MRGRAGKRTAGIDVRPVGWFAPLLIASVVVLIVCVNTKFSVALIQQENRDLQGRLQELREGVERAEVDVARLTGRERIEKVAATELGLHAPGPKEQVFLPEWEASPPPPPVWGSLAATIRDEAGRGIGRIGGLFGGGAPEREGPR